jgi:hypothetical protein
LRSYEESGVLEDIRLAGGQVYGITSEPHSLGIEAQDAWDISIPVVGDPHHEIRKELKSRGWINIFYNTNYGHLRDREWASHPKGYYQPAVIAIDKSERLLYRWRCIPKYSNMSGAGARPEARYTWDQVYESISNFKGNAAFDSDPLMGGQDLPWFKFVLIMLGHGWFVRPKAFPLLRDGGKDHVSPKKAMRRWKFFALFWAVLFFVFPISWVGGAIIIWLIALIPGLYEIHYQFQNEHDRN